MVIYDRFDGDGMLHAVRIHGGQASYSNSYVGTTRLAKERAAGRSLFSKVCSTAWPAACQTRAASSCCAALGCSMPNLAARSSVQLDCLNGLLRDFQGVLRSR